MSVATFTSYVEALQFACAEAGKAHVTIYDMVGSGDPSRVVAFVDCLLAEAPLDGATTAAKELVYAFTCRAQGVMATYVASNGTLAAILYRDTEDGVEAVVVAMPRPVY